MHRKANKPAQSSVEAIRKLDAEIASLQKRDAEIRGGRR